MYPSAAGAAKMKLWGSAALLFASAATMLSSSDMLPLSGLGGGGQRRLQGATEPLRRLAQTDYGSVGNGYCGDALHDSSVIEPSSGLASPSAEDCSAKCDDDGSCVAFEYDSDVAGATSGIMPCVLWSLYDPNNFSSYSGSTCYVKISYLDSINESYVSVLGDPLFTGFKGQLIKFEGRDSAWYANLASPSLQWNLNFHKVGPLSLVVLFWIMARGHPAPTKHILCLQLITISYLFSFVLSFFFYHPVRSMPSRGGYVRDVLLYQSAEKGRHC